MANIDPKDAARGLYQKFTVIRNDGRSAPGEKHERCAYFVLDLDHDPFAYEAIRTYAQNCRKKYPALADDLVTKLIEMQKRPAIMNDDHETDSSER
jgi:hypothetical protein